MAAIPTSRLRAALASFALFALVCDVPLSAQEGAAPPPAPALSAEQVAELVAPIALYPDALLTQLLIATTNPLEIVAASRWLARGTNKNLKGKALEDALKAQPWQSDLLDRYSRVPSLVMPERGVA